MGPKEIAVEYRTAINKQKQIKVLAELNQCAERKIAEILVGEGEELPKKYEEMLKKPARQSRKFPDEKPADFCPKGKSAENPEPETDAEPEEEPVESAESPRSDEGIAPYADEGAEGISAEQLLRTACRLMASALALSPDDYHTYSCGVLDLVHALTEE